MIFHNITELQAKAPTEFTYIETASQTITNVISVRRMTYLQVILKIHANEITNRVYNAMKISHLPGNCIHKVKADFECVGLELNECQ